MAEPLKNLYTTELIQNLSEQICVLYPEFDSAGFGHLVFDEYWHARELKERMRHVTVALKAFLPESYLDAIRILKAASEHFSGFEYMFFPDYVEMYGLDSYQASVEALEHMTPYSTSELAVRPFIKKYTEMMDQMLAWSKHPNYHVRRLASEGCRPRLPWAIGLPDFKKDPTLILPILEQLKDDEAEYVRRSVANNLNDISKDHPDLVVEISNKWIGDNPQRDKLVKHACRTLLKQGHPDVMAMFGYTKPDHIVISGLTVERSVAIGERLAFSFELTSQAGPLGKIRLEYIIGFLRKNGTLSDKVFKISESEVQSSNKHVTKEHSFRLITTRRYYPGKQALAILVNGVELARTSFELTE